MEEGEGDGEGSLKIDKVHYEMNTRIQKMFSNWHEELQQNETLLLYLSSLSSHESLVL